MSLKNRLFKKDEAPQKQQEYNQTDASAAEDTHMSEQILARNSRPNHPMRRATDLTQRGNIFATMAGSGPAPDDEIRSDHNLASSLPVPWPGAQLLAGQARTHRLAGDGPSRCTV